MGNNIRDRFRDRIKLIAKQKNVKKIFTNDNTKPKDKIDNLSISQKQEIKSTKPNPNNNLIKLETIEIKNNLPKNNEKKKEVLTTSNVIKELIVSKNEKNNINILNSNSYNSRLKYTNYVSNTNILKQTENNKETKSITNLDEEHIEEPQSIKKIDNQIETLEHKILKGIDKELNKIKNELDFLSSEFYVLNEIKKDEVITEKYKENFKQIKHLQEKIESLQTKYKKYKENYYFENTLDYNDNELLEDIINYKNITSNEESRELVEEYKMTNIFKYLYEEITKLEEDNKELEEIREEKEKNLEKRDIEHKKLKEKIIDVDYYNDQNKRFINSQVSFLNELQEKVTKIEKEERIDYHIVGIDTLVTNSLKYLGTLLICPLTGLIPGIAISTIATRNMLRNIRNAVHIEEDRKIVYSAQNFQDSINYGLHNVKEVMEIGDKTLDEIKTTKEEFLDKYGKYRYQVPEIDNTINKINKMENVIINNKQKLKNIQNKMVDRKIENINTTNLVKTLNNN